jgi:hypothetical protein
MHQRPAKHVEGDYQPVTVADVWRRATDDPNRKPERDSAIGMLSRITNAKRGDTARFCRARAPVERLREMIDIRQYKAMQSRRCS